MPGSLSAAGQRREVSLEPASVFDEGSAVLTPSDFAVLFVTAQSGSGPAGVRLLRPAPLARISTPGPTGTLDLIDRHRSCLESRAGSRVGWPAMPHTCDGQRRLISGSRQQLVQSEGKFEFGVSARHGPSQLGFSGANTVTDRAFMNAQRSRCRRRILAGGEVGA